MKYFFQKVSQAPNYQQNLLKIEAAFSFSFFLNPPRMG